jgi:PAS domain S-box-containing protein
MTAFSVGRQHRLTVGAAAFAAALCIALVLVGQLHLVRGGLLTGILAVLVASCAALIVWQNRSLIRSAERQSIQRAIIDSSPNAVVISDSQGHVIALNPAAERIFAREATSIGRLLISDLIAAPDQAEADAGHTHPNILDRLGERIIVDGRRPDCATFPAEISILRVGQGGHTMFAAYIRDLTEQRRADADHEAQQERIHQTEKLSAMGSLLAGVAHELNNPLAILVTQATLLREKAPTPDVARRAERIHAAAQRAGRIVKSFLAMARQKAPVRVPVDLNGIIEAAVELVGYGLRSAGVEVVFELSTNLPPVAADRDLMGQVFANVLINAQQALADRPEPRIRITTRREAGAVVTEIADNGPGIPDDVRDRIFEPYFTTKPVGAGTGIGLSVCRNVVTAHGGTIEVVPAETGAVIRIAVPVAAPAPPRPRPAGEKGLSVLVVDDELDVAESLAELMDIFGHRAVVISSPMDALDRLRQQSFDAVFTDLRMPGMSGLSLRQKIRAIDPDLANRTVIMTGDTVMGPLSEPDADGGLMLEKPFTADSVRALLEQVRAR